VGLLFILSNYTMCICLILRISPIGTTFNTAQLYNVYISNYKKDFTKGTTFYIAQLYNVCMYKSKMDYTNGTTFYVAQIYMVCMHRLKMDFTNRDYILCCPIIQGVCLLLRRVSPRVLLFMLLNYTMCVCINLRWISPRDYILCCLMIQCVEV
jgi:hypothetical protein